MFQLQKLPEEKISENLSNREKVKSKKYVTKIHYFSNKPNFLFSFLENSCKNTS